MVLILNRCHLPTSRYLDVVVSDSSRPPWRICKSGADDKGLMLDAVLTDPPYGIRSYN